MQEELKKLVSNALSDIKGALKESELLNIKAKYLGKKSKIAELMSGLKDMSIEDKKQYGSLFNKIKKDLENKISERIAEVNVSSDISFDETLPVTAHLGSLHPVTIVTKEVTDILRRMGFSVVSGPEMETEYFNFEALNIPESHPARDMQDTYWLDNGKLLRTHTSPNQVHAMQKYGAPIKICAPGRCFRNEDLDASHENTFFQVEGMVIDKNISIGNLMYTMKELLSAIFKTDVDVRVRPGFFPFVEPGVEIDCSCLICGGKGCPTCKNSGWIELCPGGMIHPNVLKESGIDPEEYTGFAFGLGITRLAMMKYKIDDIRILNSGDLRALDKFNVE